MMFGFHSERNGWPPFVGPSCGSAVLLFFGSLAVNSKTLSRASHGNGGKTRAAIIVDTMAVIRTLSRFVFMSLEREWLTTLSQLQNRSCYWQT